MTDFRFLHAADIHLDSPLYGLSRYEGLPEADIRGATRAAFNNLIQRAIDEQVDFVLIAGDLFDGDWKDMGTGLYFARAMGRLNKAGIPAFILAGNHDAASVITRNIPWPPNVTVFDKRRPETHRLPELGVAIHGQSFATSAVTENLVLAYPDAHEHAFNIGMLHTALAGREGHAAYAPCSLDDLKGKRYDYWALGHVHEHEVVCSEPHVVFPGNTQGRTIRETGAKGAVIVTVQDAQVTGIDHIELGVIRWATAQVDCTGASVGDAPHQMREALQATWQQNPPGVPLVVRVTLAGTTPDAGAFLDRAMTLRDEARAVAASISPDLFIEKVKVGVKAPPDDDRTEIIGDDITGLLAQGAHDQALIDLLREDLEPFLSMAQTVLGPPEEADIRGLATEGEWAALLDSASRALRARLTREA